MDCLNLMDLEEKQIRVQDAGDRTRWKYLTTSGTPA